MLIWEKNGQSFTNDSIRCCWAANPFENWFLDEFRRQLICLSHFGSYFFSLVFLVIFSMIYLWIKPNDIEVFLGKLNSNPINLYLLSSPTQQKQQNPKRHKKIYNKEEAATAKYAKKHILRHFRWEAENQKRNRNQKPSQWIETDLLNRCHTRNIIICQSKSTLCVIQLLLFYLPRLSLSLVGNYEVR